MRSSAPPPSDGGSVVTPYTTTSEPLRSHVLDGTTASGLVGLILVIRDGLAAWMTDAMAHAMAHAAPRPTTTHAAVPTDRRTAPPIASGDIRPNLICVLANMAMAILPEGHP
jgi:hypothetical protein